MVYEISGRLVLVTTYLLGLPTLPHLSCQVHTAANSNLLRWVVDSLRAPI